MSIQERYLVIEEERRERADQRFKDQAAKRQEEQFQRESDEIARAVQSAVARMSPEEKARLLVKYGMRELDQT